MMSCFAELGITQSEQQQRPNKVRPNIPKDRKAKEEFYKERTEFLKNHHGPKKDYRQNER